MRLIVLSLAFTAIAVADDQAQKLIDTIDSLRSPLEDFQCEVEGTVRFASETSMGSQIATEELRDSFSGTFLWRKDGDFWYDSFHEDIRARRKIERRTVVVRSRERHAEEHRRFNDAVNGQQTFGSPSIFRTRLGLEGPWDLLLLDDLRDQTADETHTASLHDDRIDGRALKVLEIRFKDINQLLRRYWIDLGHNGHVVRFEAYWNGERLRLRRDIKLAKFGLAGAEIWMPVSAEQITYSAPTASETGKSQPESSATISILDGTMAFNVGLHAKNFAIDYRAGKPTSASGRRRSDQYDQQTLAAKTIDGAAQKARNDPIAPREPEQEPGRDVVARPASQFEIRYVAFALTIVAIIAFGSVWTRRRHH
jgi:hypothetical protein